MERKLAAILAADVVGYSMLMAENEEATLTLLREHRVKLFDPKVAEHNGRIIKLMGDGTLVEFGSVVDAVNCAVAVQSALRQSDSPIRLRIGINIGDIIVEGDDIYGDGVNIAARLEGLAEADGICVSRDVYNQVHAKVEAGFDDLGEQTVKNIPEPIQVYRILLDGPAARQATVAVRKTKRSVAWSAISGGIAVLFMVAGVLFWQRPWQQHEEPASVINMAFPLPDKPSIAVLPFNNMSGDPSQDYFADGMTEDLITDLSKISGLFVIARNSSFSYKGKQVKIRKVAEELGVRFVLEGSVRRAGKQVRINAQLIDATTGGHLWAERYDGSGTDVFGLQDKVTKNIVDALSVALTPREAETASKVGTTSVAAYDAYLRGLSYYNRRTPKDNATAKTHFEKAIELDANYAEAYSALANVYVQGLFGMFEFSRRLGFGWFDGTPRPWTYLQQARKRPDQTYFIVRSRLALKRHLTDQAIVEARRALDLSSNDAEAMETLAQALIYSGQERVGMEYAQRAMRQNPAQPGHSLYLMGLAEFSLGNTEEAIKYLTRAIQHAPTESSFSGLLAAAYGELGQVENAKAAFEDWNTSKDNWFLDDVAQHYPFSTAKVLERFAGGLRVAGLSVRTAGYLPLHSANRLSGPEIRSLVFGSTVGGSLENYGAGNPTWRQRRDSIGTVEQLRGTVQAGVRAGDIGEGRIDNDALCETWPKLARDIELCVAFFRITDHVGRIHWGDYVMVTDRGALPFSVID